MPSTDHIRNKLSQLPHKPGVYLMKDRFGTVIYVGKARDLRKRVSQYFHPSRRHGWDLKLNALVEAIHDLDVHTVRSEPEALLLEGKLIKEFQPRYNISFRDDKQFMLLKVNLNDPIPRFTLTRMKQEDGARYFGPFAHSSALRGTLAMARKKFNLRGCRPLTPNDSDYKHCLYGNLKFCTAPCIGNVTREQYLLQVEAACDFLSGQSQEMEQQLEAEMRKAAAALDFEKAAQLRDALADLRQTTKKTNKFERIPYTLPVSLDPARDVLELGEALGLPKTPVRIEGFDISNISGTFAVASMVSFKNGRPDRSNYRRFRMKTVTGQDDFACMAETVQRRYSRLRREAEASSLAPEPAEEEPLDQETPEMAETQSVEGQPPVQPLPPEPTPHPALSPSRGEGMAGERPAPPLPVPLAGGEGRGEGVSPSVQEFPSHKLLSATAPPEGERELPPPSTYPDLILIDGGKGQLNAATRELNKLGLSHIPVIGVAKEFEEIYRPGEPEPIRLSHSSGALKLLQRVRDESHRFANTYNAKLRLRKISESLLDEFPGIGQQRKSALLKKFGSLQRLRMATVEEISEVSGFGGKAAQELKTFLEARQA